MLSLIHPFTLQPLKDTEVTISWNMHDMNLKVVGQKETEREKNKYAVTVII